MVVFNDDEDEDYEYNASGSEGEDSWVPPPPVLLRTPGAAPPVVRPRKLSELSDEGRQVWERARSLEERLRQLTEL